MRTLQAPRLREKVLTRASASAPGSCGELAQGMLEENLVMVTCPIDLFSTATVEISRGAGVVQGPGDSPKATMAVSRTLAHLGRTDVNARLRLESPIPRQKGMAGSTADIIASIGAAAAALGEPIPVARQAELALSIEPSDGTMFPGVALFDHRTGLVARPLGEPPPMEVLVLEYPDGVDTEAFNKTDRRPALERRSHRFLEAFGLIAAGLETGDGVLIGLGATLDAVAYQDVFPNPYLETGLQLARAAGALGVNVAHSGTVLGLLFLDDPEQVRWAADKARAAFSGLVSTRRHRLIGGGLAGRSPGRYPPVGCAGSA
ncbi:MAG: GHMP kinase [Acidimicrobiia bacterium]|nr:GHMP kinase [Acidimicrobiia bacterium]